MATCIYCGLPTGEAADEHEACFQRSVAAGALRDAETRYRRHAARAETSREERNVAVRAAVGAGMTHAQIARETELTRARVGQIALGSRPTA